MDYREKVRNGELYLRLNKLLRYRLPQIRTTLVQELHLFLIKKQFTKPFDLICELELHRWGQDTQWRIEIDFDDYEWSYETNKPHGLGAYILLEEVARKKTLHFSYGIYNTFNSKILSRETEKIIELQIFYYIKRVKSKLREIELFLEKIRHLLIIEIKQINLQKLELLEE